MNDPFACCFGTSVAGMAIGEGAPCGRLALRADDKECWNGWTDESDSIYCYVPLCEHHQVELNDLALTMSGLLDVIAEGLLPSRAELVGPVRMSAGYTMTDISSAVARMLQAPRIQIEAPTAGEIAAHMHASEPTLWLQGSLARLAHLGYVTVEPGGRHRPTALGKLAANVSRAEIAAAGIAV
jgi:hypothetical protein